MDALILLLLISLGFIYVVSNNVDLDGRHSCDYGCKAYDVPICATNKVCTIRFVGKCMMDMYNCLYPHKAFHQTEDSKCGDSWAPECISDMTSRANIGA